jgi:hypothetical protein
MHLFSFITHEKSSKIVLSGSLDFYSSLAFAEGLYSLKKKDFLK